MNRKSRFCLFALLLFAVAGMAANKKFTLVIDPGHGGKDHGAPGVYSKEKDLTLKFGLAFGRMVERNCPDVKVIYTRKTDVFIPLARRAEIANNNKADLFISVHINALGSGKQISGFQTYTLGRGQNSGKKGIAQNLEVAKRENSVILLEDNYQQTYQGFDPNSPESNIMFEFIQDKNMEKSVELAKYMQQHVCAATGLKDMGAHQNNLAVLRLSSMPSCLLELGFISTQAEEDFMNSAGAEEKYARGIFNAFAQYKNKYHQGVVVPYKAAKRAEPQIPEIVPEVYKEQAQRGDGRSVEQIGNAPVVLIEKPKTVEMPITEEPKSDTPVIEIPANQAEIAPVQPVFKIQILSSSRKLQPGNNAFKGLNGCEWYEENGVVKYTYGASADYNEIRRLRKDIIDRFPDAFIIAFKDGKKIDVNQAIQLFLQNKKK